MKTWLLIGLLLVPFTVSLAQDVDLLESARELSIVRGKMALNEEIVKTLTVENARLRQQLAVVAARCP